MALPRLAGDDWYTRRSKYCSRCGHALYGIEWVDAVLGALAGLFAGAVLYRELIILLYGPIAKFLLP